MTLSLGDHFTSALQTRKSLYLSMGTLDFGNQKNIYIFLIKFEKSYKWSKHQKKKKWVGSQTTFFLKKENAKKLPNDKKLA
jgi:hypothetical protein